MLIMLHNCDKSQLCYDCDIKMYSPIDVPPPIRTINLVNLLYAVCTAAFLQMCTLFILISIIIFKIRQCNNLVTPKISNKYKENKYCLLWSLYRPVIYLRHSRHTHDSTIYSWVINNAWNGCLASRVTLERVWFYPYSRDTFKHLGLIFQS